MWPGGNTTALVKQKFPRAKYSQLANKIMAADPSIEQVGFIEKPTQKHAHLRLHMMGGEFCVNATRSTAFLYAKEHKLKKVFIETCGLEEVLEVDIKGETTHIHLTSDFLLKIKKIKEGLLVDLKGIRHIIIFDEKKHSNYRKILEAYKEDRPAVGIMYIEKKVKFTELKPYVWVRETDTYIFETGCGSGSIAAAVALHHLDRTQRDLKIRQPSKEVYDIKLKKQKGKLKKITLKGKVKRLGKG